MKFSSESDTYLTYPLLSPLYELIWDKSGEVAEESWSPGGLRPAQHASSSCFYSYDYNEKKTVITTKKKEMTMEKQIVLKEKCR